MKKIFIFICLGIIMAVAGEAMAESKPVQLGFVNYAATATSGVQIGIINLIPKSEWFTGFPGELAPGMIIVNWRF